MSTNAPQQQTPEVLHADSDVIPCVTTVHTDDFTDDHTKDAGRHSDLSSHGDSPCGDATHSDGIHNDATIHDEIYCPYFQHAVELIGRRWTGVVLAALSHSPMRYSHLRAQIPGLSDRLLTERLTELEAEGIVDRTNPVGSPLYQLTPFGRELIPVIEAIQTFAHASAVRMGALERPGRRHDTKAR